MPNEAARPLVVGVAGGSGSVKTGAVIVDMPATKLSAIPGER